MTRTSHLMTSIAIIGTGLIGKRHLNHVISEPLTRLAAIVEPLPAGKELAAEHGVPCYASVAELIAARDANEVYVDAAIVGTPTHTFFSHVPIGVQLIDAGLHALVEKPIAGTRKEAQLLVDAVEKAGGKAKVLVGQHRRFNPYTVALKSALNSGKLGKLLGIQGTWATKKGGNNYFSDWKILPAGGGTININMIHDVDLLRYLFGDIKRVYCEEGERTRGHPVEETGAVVLKFASGAVGTFFFSDATASPWCWEGATGENPDLVGQYSKDIYTIFGTHGSIQLPTLSLFTFDHLPDPEKDGNWLTRLSEDLSIRETLVGIVDVPPFTLQLQHFVRVCQGLEEPSCSALEGLRSVDAVEAIKVSMVERRVVEIE
ncbi:hypothetical protein BDZ94DRAFT_1235851 [Collybia nuda]|uniref:Oxidoreductase n=1 Tax=Collybia nuda TaxID=64659 RepID=A0A9P5Y9I0_9AGAR|nr:hypothetical protein BDZ94DRAFT_1235851 [Collybia nuda]